MDLKKQLSKMKNIEIAYLLIVIVMLFTGALLVGLYYVQDFSEDLDWTKVLYTKDIKYDLYPQKNTNLTYIRNLKADIGTLTLQNEGFIERKYELPEFKGCVHGEQKSNNYGGYSSFNLQFDLRYYDESGYMHKGNTINVKVGERKTFDIRAESYGNVPLSTLTEKGIDSIAVYDVSKKPNNPLNDLERGYSSNYIRKDCSSLSNQAKPIHTLSWVN
jgi:hypothetical protein